LISQGILLENVETVIRHLNKPKANSLEKLLEEFLFFGQPHFGWKKSGKSVKSFPTR